MQYCKYIFLQLLLYFMLLANAYAEHKVDTHGSTWGEFRYPSSLDKLENDNYLIEGAFDQNLVTYKLTPNTNINYFLKLGYTADSNNIDYNNKISISPGIKLSHAISDHASLAVGVMYKYEYRRVEHTDYTSPTYFIDWSGGWSLDCKACSNGNNSYPISFPGNTWGSITTPSALTKEEDGNMLLEGSVEQGIVWAITDAGALNSFIDIAYKADTKGIDWNNSINMSLGVKLDKQLSKNLSISYGIKYGVEKHWLNNDGWNNDTTIFLNWGASWSSF